MDYRFYPGRKIRHWLSGPFIWSMIVPLFILDIGIEIYHQICFRLYGIQRVSRSEYIKIDRHRLKYLEWYDKVNCAYCGYANGLLAYAVEIAARTEQYWCGIKHGPQKGFHAPAHHKSFVKYGDEKAFKKRYCKLE